MAQVSAEKLEHTEPAKKERVVSAPLSKQLVKTLKPSLPKGAVPLVQITKS